MPEPMSQPSHAPALKWLAAGAAAGLLAAAFGLLNRTAPLTLPDTAVAKVNDVLIDGDRYQRALDTHKASIGRDPNTEERERVLRQLLDEELLVQRGVDLGMPESETTVRSAIIQSLIASVTAETDAANPSDDELQRFLEDNADNYTYSSALELDAWVTDDEWQAQDFISRLREDAGVDDTAQEGVRRVPGLPEGAIPLERLRMFVGPAIAATALDMPAGSSAVYARQGRWYVVRVNRHAESTLADLDAVRSQVLIDYRRRLADTRLREYLDDLYGQADITIVAPQ